MKKLFALVMGLMVVSLVSGVAIADIAFKTETVMHFYISGEPVEDSVDYEITCDGWYQDYDMLIEADSTDSNEYLTLDPEEVFSYSATCEEFACSIDQSYYLNYREINSCDLTAEVDGKTYELKDFNDTPIPPVEKEADDDWELKFEGYFDLVDGMMVYKDVAPGDDSFDAIKFITERGFVNGYPDGTYKANSTLNRAEFTKILVLTDYLPYEVKDCDLDEYGFKDVLKNSWYAPYICVAKRDGIVSGYEDGTFKPENYIKFVEAAKIAVEVMYDDFDEGESEIWYEPYVEALEEANAVPDSIKEYDSYTTRGEMAEVVYGVLGDFSDVEGENTDSGSEA